MTNSERINNTSKRDQRIARDRAAAAFSSPMSLYGDIHEAYNKPSRRKVQAWKRCESLCRECGGWGLAIASRNCDTFTAVFQFKDESGRLCLAYITRSYDRFAYAEA